MSNLATVFRHGARGSIAALALIAAAALSGCNSGSDAAPATSQGTPQPSTPVISGTPPVMAQVTMNYQFTPTASDRDGKPLTFQITNQPSWTTFSAATGKLSGIPTAGNIGSFSGIVITVTDGTRSASLPAFAIQVAAAPNLPPVINGVPATSVQAGTAYTFQPTASDPEGSPLTFNIQNMPAWATFNQATGRLTGTPSAANAGVYTRIVIGVSDGALTTSLPAFDITVTTTGNRPPVISGAPPAAAQVGVAYTFTPTASDPDGNTLTFSITGMPSWANFSTSTGRLSGTPTAAGTFAGITITVTDGQASVSLAAFTITVAAAGNRPPVISGTPGASAPAGQAYVFTPTASDPDGNTLTYSIQNRPLWATFSTTTGVLSGTPATSDANTYAGIVITVTDGQASASLAAFTITVTQVGSGSAALTWTAPTLNTDGSSLTDLSSYKIYYGTSPSALNQQSAAISVGMTTSSITGLNSGTWYFAMTATNAGGTESARTNVASKVVP